LGKYSAKAGKFLAAFPLLLEETTDNQTVQGIPWLTYLTPMVDFLANKSK
jgi:hypothetical protein